MRLQDSAPGGPAGSLFGSMMAFIFCDSANPLNPLLQAVSDSDVKGTVLQVPRETSSQSRRSRPTTATKALPEHTSPLSRDDWTVRRGPQGTAPDATLQPPAPRHLTPPPPAPAPAPASAHVPEHRHPLPCCGTPRAGHAGPQLALCNQRHPAPPTRENVPSASPSQGRCPGRLPHFHRTLGERLGQRGPCWTI